MIELPPEAVPNNARPALMDFGNVLRPSTGAKTDRYDRKGNRFRCELTLPPLQPDVSRVVVSRLLQAKHEGARVPYPLIGGPQGSPGTPVVNGAGQAGTTLNIRGLTPHWRAKEGYWFSIEAASGQHYLHNCRSNRAANSSGVLAIEIETELRVPFADGDKVHFAVPMIEGLVPSETIWEIPVDHLIRLGFTIEETE